MFRRRMLASGMIGGIGAAIGVGPIVPRAPLAMAFYLATLLAACAWIMLLAMLDVWATRRHYRQLRMRAALEAASVDGRNGRRWAKRPIRKGKRDARRSVSAGHRAGAALGVLLAAVAGESAAAAVSHLRRQRSVGAGRRAFRPGVHRAARFVAAGGRDGGIRQLHLARAAGVLLAVGAAGGARRAAAAGRLQRQRGGAAFGARRGGGAARPGVALGGEQPLDCRTWACNYTWNRSI